MFVFKFLHALYQCPYTLNRESIVERRTEASHRAVTGNAHHTLRLGKIAKLLLELLVVVRHDETDVHQRPVLRIGYSYLKQLVALDLII